MGIVRVWGTVVRTIVFKQNVGRRNGNHIPTAKRRIAVGIFRFHGGIRNFVARQLKLRVVAAHPHLLQRFADHALFIFFFYFCCSESFVVEKQHGEAEIFNEFGLMARRELRRQITVELSFHFVGGHGSGRNVQLGRNRSGRANSVIRGKSDYNIGKTKLLSKKIKEPRQLAGFFDFLGKQFGLANVVIALSADHGVGPTAAVTSKLHISSGTMPSDKMEAKLNSDLSAKLTPGHQTKFIEDFGFTMLFLNDEAFAAAKVKEEDAERMVGESLKQMGMRGYYTKFQLARNEVPNSAVETKYANSYSPLGGWYVIAVPPPYVLFEDNGADHGSPYTYDAHVPLSLYS